MRSKLKIKVGKDKVAWQGRFNRVVARDFVGIDGKKDVWEFIERKTHGPVAVVIPVTTEGEVIFIKHFRIPRNGYVLETPAGIMDLKGEKPAALAKRELLEETGYRARSMKLVACGANNGGLQNEDYYFFVAIDCVKVAEAACESSEDIEIITVPLAKLDAFLGARRNYLAAAPLFGIPYFLRKAGVM